MIEDMNLIEQALQSQLPCFIGRIAGIELQTAYHVCNNNRIEVTQDIGELENNAGIHITSVTSLQTYVDQLLQSYDHCTHIAEWETVGKVYAITGRGQELISKRTPHILKCHARELEPYYENPSWMPALKGKRILIVHPFAATLQKQVPHLKEIFPDRSWFEDVSFQFIRPPLTLAGNHRGIDWQDHLKPCLEEIQQCEFDVALVAAGGYGMLISDYIYTTMKKSAIYVGGALQLFFGVIGKRWFDNKEILAMMNDHWIRPTASDRPQNHTKVEKGCYW
jgi:hypothetical protein